MIDRIAELMGRALVGAWTFFAPKHVSALRARRAARPLTSEGVAPVAEKLALDFAGLRSKTMLCVGAGGLGQAFAEPIVRAGVNLVVVDPDVVELSNLSRGRLGKGDVGKYKVLALADRLARSAASGARIVGVPQDAEIFLQGRAFARLAPAVSLVVAAVDNDDTRDALQRWALEGTSEPVPFITGGLAHEEPFDTGYALLHMPGDGACFACYRAAMPAPAEGEMRCADEVRVQPAVVDLCAASMADLALRVLDGRAGGPASHLIHVGNGASGETRRFAYARPDCVCQRGQADTRKAVSKRPAESSPSANETWRPL